MEEISIGMLLFMAAMGAVSGICKGLQARGLAERAVDEEMKKRRRLADLARRVGVPTNRGRLHDCIRSGH